MKFLEVLVEGYSDIPVVREILTRRLKLREDTDFRIIPHRGKGTLPRNPLAQPEPRRRGLLDQLPAKIRAYAHLEEYWIVVLVDSDNEDCRQLKKSLVDMYNAHPFGKRARKVLFRIAVTEIESWIIADPEAIRKTYPACKLNRIPSGKNTDDIVNAWECLARVLGHDPNVCTNSDKQQWAEKIAPNLDLHSIRSPSLQAFIDGIERIVRM